ncbi:hypothetical protein [Hymenobacter cavernae]|uniref:Uncharacterized protein n=1 Tax=Hymenobacter cavernae TaxID=2044852 RepID=A0ABQ1UFX3_9BACT|nr:hypothetical protein [Hymenobacter cavernae]GGF15378.1 hypothetical protein GCM10011383_28320 [Hymenobacter cavernae]
MSDTTKRARTRKTVEATPAPVLSHAEHMAALQAREAGKVVMYQQDAWGHIETRFVRAQNVKAWEAKGFLVR